MRVLEQHNWADKLSHAGTTCRHIGTSIGVHTDSSNILERLTSAYLNSCNLIKGEIIYLHMNNDTEENT